MNIAVLYFDLKFDHTTAIIYDNALKYFFHNPILGVIICGLGISRIVSCFPDMRSYSIENVNKN